MSDVSDDFDEDEGVHLGVCIAIGIFICTGYLMFGLNATCYIFTLELHTTSSYNAPFNIFNTSKV